MNASACLIFLIINYIYDNPCAWKISIIKYNEKRWDVDNLFSSAVMLPNESFLEFTPDFRFILYDLSRYSDDDIKGEILLKLPFSL